LKNGKGICYSKNKDTYYGEYKNDLRDGKGVIEKKNGDRYEGEWS